MYDPRADIPRVAGAVRDQWMEEHPEANPPEEAIVDLCARTIDAMNAYLLKMYCSIMSVPQTPTKLALVRQDFERVKRAIGMTMELPGNHVVVIRSVLQSPQDAARGSMALWRDIPAALDRFVLARQK